MTAPAFHQIARQSRRASAPRVVGIEQLASDSLIVVMSATKILWGQISLVFAIVLVAVWASTQWTAWRLGYQSQLGSPWFELAHVPIYFPPTFFWWWYAFDAYAPAIFVEGACIAASGGFISIGVAIVSICRVF